MALAPTHIFCCRRQSAVAFFITCNLIRYFVQSRCWFLHWNQRCYWCVHSCIFPFAFNTMYISVKKRWQCKYAIVRETALNTFIYICINNILIVMTSLIYVDKHIQYVQSLTNICTCLHLTYICKYFYLNLKFIKFYFVKTMYSIFELYFMTICSCRCT